ncbi:18021_t:CDS:2 [Gigaspora margarita]|uniref:18021_t:CDS:1 n=1 Tax=Gigaspora margarita TaxID=4874 RepID=A0ABN7URB3_GIGMA|nr:18021_t:CDS:2 [Gigaspora margarita]
MNIHIMKWVNINQKCLQKDISYQSFLNSFKTFEETNNELLKDI